MSKTTTIKLSEPIQGHEGEVREVILREPRYGDLIALGEPSAFARSEAGMVFTTERDDAIGKYVERLLVSPKDPGLLMQVSLADGMKLKDAIHGFFGTARELNSMSGQSS